MRAIVHGFDRVLATHSRALPHQSHPESHSPHPKLQRESVGAVNHAVQHLGGRDHGNAQPVCRGNQPLLQDGDVLSWEFNAQVTLATMTPSHNARIASICSIASCFSILAITGAWHWKLSL